MFDRKLQWYIKEEDVLTRDYYGQTRSRLKTIVKKMLALYGWVLNPRPSRDETMLLTHRPNRLIHQTCNKNYDMMTSSNRSIFHVTGPLWGDSTGHRWIPLTKTSDAELWSFLWSASVQRVKQAIETQVIWDDIALIMTSSKWGWSQSEHWRRKARVLGICSDMLFLWIETQNPMHKCELVTESHA